MRARVETTDGRTLDGVVLNRTAEDLQLRPTTGASISCARRATRYRPVTSQADWPTYHGQYGGNRFSALDQIDKTHRRAPRSALDVRAGRHPRLEGDAGRGGRRHVRHRRQRVPRPRRGNGRRLWDYRRPRTKGLAGDAASGINRGVAVAGDRVFLVTDNAHILALDRFTGALLWDTEMADSGQNYGATSAPLAVGDAGDLRHLGRRRRRARLRGRVRSGDGEGGVALLDRAQAGRARIRDLAGHATSIIPARRPG